MSRLRAVSAVLVLSFLPVPADAVETSVIAIQVFAPPAGPFPIPGGAYTERWGTELRILNPLQHTVNVAVEDVLPLLGGRACAPERPELPPGETTRVLCSYQALPPIPPVVFFKLRATDAFVVSDELTRTRETCYGDNPNCDCWELGRVPLPLFDGPFPAAATSLAGAVGLGSRWDPKTRKRLNITLANYGDSPATFRITVHPLNTAPGNAITSFDQGVPARDVLQLNDVRFDWGNAPTAWNCSDKVWVSVTADQPYLFYVSTVLVQQDPGTMPFEVLKPTLLPRPLP